MITNYTLTGTKSKTIIEVSYNNGFLTSFKIDLNTPLTEAQFNAFIGCLSFTEDNVDFVKNCGLNVSRNTSNQKIALFCSFYKEYMKLPYKVTKADSGKIKHIKLTDEILKAYFTSINNLFKNKRSISNLVNFYNELLAEIAAGSTAQYPNGYDRKFESHLTEKDKPGYWSHLRSLGLVARKNRTGMVTDWIKADLSPS